MEVFTVTLITVSMILLIFIPGFLLSLAFYPRKDEIDSIERAGLSLVLGLFPQFLLYFADKNFFIPINAITSYMTILLVSLVGLGVWLHRKSNPSVS